MRLKAGETGVPGVHFLARSWMFPLQGSDSLILDPFNLPKSIQIIHLIKFPSNKTRDDFRLVVSVSGRRVVDVPIRALEWKYQRFDWGTSANPNLYQVAQCVGGSVGSAPNPEDPTWNYSFTQLPRVVNDSGYFVETGSNLVQVGRVTKTPSVSFYFDIPLWIPPNTTLEVMTPIDVNNRLLRYELIVIGHVEYGAQ